MSVASISQAVWEYTPRTLASGSPPAPTTSTEAIAKAVWEYVTRTVTGGGSSGRILISQARTIASGRSLASGRTLATSRSSI